MGLKLYPGLATAVEVTFNPASVAAATAAEQTVTVAGVDPANTVLLAVEPPAHGVAVGIAGARVSAVNTVAITFINPSAGALDAASGTYKIVYANYK